MTGEIKAAIAILGVLGAAVGIAFAASTSKASTPSDSGGVPPTPAPTPTPPASTVTWTRATSTIPKGVAVAVAVDQSNMPAAATAANLPTTSTDIGGVFLSPAVAAVIGTTPIITYEPGAGRPPSWPSDDPSPATEYGIAFVSTQAFDPSLLPFPAIVWTAPLTP